MVMKNKLLTNARRLVSRIGRRGSYLFFLAMLDILFGYSILVPVTPTLAQSSLVLPAVAWGWIWLGVGVVLFFQAFAKLDRVGFTLAVILKFAWGSVALYDWLLVPGDVRGWASVAVWWGFAILTAIVANWPEHRLLQVGVLDDDDGKHPSSAAGGNPG